MPTENTFSALQPAFDALALLFLQPETLGAAAQLPHAAEAILEAGGSLTQASRNRLDEIAAGTPGSDLQLAQAYAKLFLGVGEKTIPLCESAWTSAQHLLCQGAELECRRIYEDAGLELAGGSVVPEDHLGLMLGFLAVSALRGDVRTGLSFYQTHAAPLIPAITEAIRARGKDAGPYLDVADLLDGIHQALS